MDNDDGLSMRNWGYYEPYKEHQHQSQQHLGLQLMPSIGDHRDTKPFLSSRENPVMVNSNGMFHSRNFMVSEANPHMNYMRDSWTQRERLIHMLPGNPNFAVIPETSAAHSMQIMQPLDSSKDPGMIAEDNLAVRKGVGVAPTKKRMGGGASTPKSPRAKKSKKTPAVPKENGNSSVPHRAKAPKKNMDVVINGIDMDISGIPIPVCSCTGTPQQCYRWGCGGWQSACCTTTISMYPLPMSTKRRGARIAGRKMSQGAFKKVLEKLASEDYNFANAIDLKSHWAKHGTNKFVTIR